MILEQGYSGVSIEAIARTAGVTRPVVYDHFPNLGELLQALIEREERYSREQLEQVVPDDPGRQRPGRCCSPAACAASSTRSRAAPGDVADHPAAARRDAGDRPPARRDTTARSILERIEHLVGWAVDRGETATDLDAELAARAIRDLGEEAGRMVLTDPQRYPPDRYERFVQIGAEAARCLA